MARIVGAGDGYQCAQKPRVYRCGGCSPRVEVEGEEPDGDV